MEQHIALLIDRNLTPVYLPQLIRRISETFSGKCTLHRVASSGSLPILTKPFPYPIPSPTEKLPETSSMEELGSADLLIALCSDPEIPSSAATIRLITPVFLSAQQGAFAPALVTALALGLPVLECAVNVRKDQTTSLLQYGCFRLLGYSYTKSLELLNTLNIELLLAGMQSCLAGLQAETMPLEKLPDFQEAHLRTMERRIRKALLHHRLQQFFCKTQWNFGWIDAPIEEVALSNDKRFTVHWATQTAEKFAADPFGVLSNASAFVLFEQLKSGKGILRIQEKGTFSEGLEQTHHLSYPYTFENEGIWYCLPEQHAAGRLVLYKVNTLRKTLTEEAVLLQDFPAVDASIAYIGQRWYIFCTDSRNKGADVRLHIFHADKLLGPYQPHALNPVKSDIRSSRPAGHLFTHLGKWYRPAQDSSTGYGGNICIHEITEISADSFKEKPVNTLSPAQFSGQFSAGIHTISRYGSKTLIDGKKIHCTWRNLFALIRKNAHAQHEVHR
jgi:hypothetical protein